MNFLWAQESTERLDNAGLKRFLPNTENKLDNIINLSCNDYLGIANSHALDAVACETIKKYGVGAKSARLTGTLGEKIYSDLENSVANFYNQESALIYSSGFLANFGAINGLIRGYPSIILDKLCHASLVDGAKYSRGNIVLAEHNSVKSFEENIKKNNLEKVLLIVESIYSVDGDLGLLNEFLELAKKYNSVLLIDDSHGLGINRLDLCSTDPVIITASMGKSLGSHGGLVIGNKKFINYLVNTSRTFIYDTMIPPASAKVAKSVIDLLSEGSLCASRIKSYRKKFAKEFLTDEKHIHSQSAVLSIPIGNAKKTYKISQDLLSEGIKVACFRPPSVPDTISRLRLSFNEALSDDNYDYAFSVMKKILEKDE